MLESLSTESYGRQTLLTAEDLPRRFELNEETVFPQLRKNKYNLLDWSLREANLLNLLDNLKHDLESKTQGSIFLFDVFVMQLYL